MDVLFFISCCFIFSDMHFFNHIRSRQKHLSVPMKVLLQSCLSYRHKVSYVVESASPNPVRNPTKSWNSKHFAQKCHFKRGLEATLCVWVCVSAIFQRGWCSNRLRLLWGQLCFYLALSSLLVQSVWTGEVLYTVLHSKKKFTCRKSVTKAKLKGFAFLRGACFRQLTLKQVTLTAQSLA